MKIVYIHYAFSDAGLTPAVASKHASFAAGTLAERFQLPLDQVHVVHRARLPEEAPIQLSCYKGKSETCPIAMAVAAKLVLPHLRNARRLLGLACGPEYILDDSLTGLLALQSPLTGWEPGDDLWRDDCVLGLLASGASLVDVDARAAWLRVQAAAATVPLDKHARTAGGLFAPSNWTKQAIEAVDSLDIGQAAAALLEHRRAEVAGLLLAKGAK